MDLKKPALLSAEGVALMLLFVLMIVLIYMLSMWFGPAQPQNPHLACGMANSTMVCHM